MSATTRLTPTPTSTGIRSRRLTSRRSRVIAAVVAFALFVAVYALSNLTAWGQSFENSLIFASDERESLAWIPYTYLRLPPLRFEVPTIVVGLVLVVVIAAVRRRWRDLLTVLVAVPASIGIDEVIARTLVKPALDPGAPIWDLTSSFPSGHVTIVAAISVALLIVVPRRHLRWCAPIVLGWVALVAVSVLALGWHRASDVFGSVLLVAALFFAASAIFQPTVAPLRRVEVKRPTAVVAIVVVVALAALFSVQPIGWLDPIFAAVSVLAVTGVAWISSRLTT